MKQVNYPCVFNIKKPNNIQWRTWILQQWHQNIQDCTYTKKYSQTEKRSHSKLYPHRKIVTQKILATQIKKTQKPISFTRQWISLKFSQYIIKYSVWCLPVHVCVSACKLACDNIYNVWCYYLQAVIMCDVTTCTLKSLTCCCNHLNQWLLIM